MKTLDAKRVLEAALICSSQPMALREMSALFAGEVGNDTLRELLDELADECKGRAIELVSVATGWRYQSRARDGAVPGPPRPRAAAEAIRARVLETLAIIAYRQPVTRGDIEDIRGVAVASSVIKQLEDRGWIEAIGYREAPGRPALLATTRQFLDDLGLATLEQLPTLEGADGEPIAPAAASPRSASRKPSLSFAEAAADAAARASGSTVPLPMQMPWNRTHERSRRSLAARRRWPLSSRWRLRRRRGRDGGAAATSQADRARRRRIRLGAKRASRSAPGEGVGTVVRRQVRSRAQRAADDAGSARFGDGRDGGSATIAAAATTAAKREAAASTAARRPGERSRRRNRRDRRRGDRGDRRRGRRRSRALPGALPLPAEFRRPAAASSPAAPLRSRRPRSSRR